MDSLESAFLAKARKLNTKRQEQLMKRLENNRAALEKAYEDGGKKAVEKLMADIRIPSAKEWKKNIQSLLTSSFKAGIMRAFLEGQRLKKLYKFAESEYDWSVELSTEWEAVIPPEAEEYIVNYAYSVGVLTDETIRDQIQYALLDNLYNGMRGEDLIAALKETVDTWLSDSHAKTIARTETAKMFNYGRLAEYTSKENDGFVVAFQYDSIVDSRTTTLCRSLDGMIVSAKNISVLMKYTPPNHYNCRASWLPITKFEEWEENFDTSHEPQKGFTSNPPKILTNQTGSLVRKKKKD
ncbi:capsid maturation protease [Bacillus phage 019DV002]|uniref:Capsid maturation protease n=1 Tax=Bacillus phage 019DV002 TaxID=2601653 RepID=A0A5J6TA83_9CAUD|nr:capsid maturation protease [Bacillus phage 019DV002]QFG05239.1 capsid maturation protease [Bacillus phage 019DV004]